MEHRKVFGDKADSKLLLEPFKAPEGIEKPALRLGQRFPGHGTSGAAQQRNGYAGVQGEPERGVAASGEEAGDVQSQMGGQRGPSLQLPGQRDTGLGRPFERFDALSPLPGQKGIDRPGQGVMKGIGFPIESQRGGKDALLLVLILPAVEGRNLKRFGQGDLHGLSPNGRGRWRRRSPIAGRERLFENQAAAQCVRRALDCERRRRLLTQNGRLRHGQMSLDRLIGLGGEWTRRSASGDHQGKRQNRQKPSN